MSRYDNNQGPPDYKAGDLVMRIKQTNSVAWPSGQVYVVEAILRPIGGVYGVLLRGKRSQHPSGGWIAKRFKKVEPKPFDFWVGEEEKEKEMS